MLFRHVSRPISLTLVVDDFGVKYSDITDYNHLRRILELQYEVTGSSTGTKYLGLTVDHNRTDRTITLSLPGYIAKLLQSVCPDGVKPAHSPFIYEPVVYGCTAPQTTATDFTPPGYRGGGQNPPTCSRLSSILCSCCRLLYAACCCCPFCAPIAAHFCHYS